MYYVYILPFAVKLEDYGVSYTFFTNNKILTHKNHYTYDAIMHLMAKAFKDLKGFIDASGNDVVCNSIIKYLCKHYGFRDVMWGSQCFKVVDSDGE